MAGSTLKTVRTVLWTLVGVAAVGAGALWYTGQSTPTTSSTRLVEAPSAPYGAGDYRLVTHDGTETDASLFVGQPSMVFFGFTHCPDVCPTTLADMKHWFAELGDDAGDLGAYFVTIDPERDTPEVLADYVGWVDERIIGVTGEADQIEAAAKAWGVHADRIPLENGDYTMSHTASVFLLDSAGRFFGTIAYEESSETAIGKLRRLMSQG